MFHGLVIPSYDSYDFTSESFRNKYLNPKTRVFSHSSVDLAPYPPYEHMHDQNLKSCAHERKLYWSFPTHDYFHDVFDLVMPAAM